MVKDKHNQAGFLAISTFVFIAHILTDFIYAALNPLVREVSHGKR